MSDESQNRIGNAGTEVSLPTVLHLAAMLKALGEPTRLSIFQFLRACCCPVAVDEETGDVRPVSGPTVGEVCCQITGKDRVTSTFSEHLKDLRVAGLILMERRGKSAICAVNPAALSALASFVTEAPPPVANDTGCCVTGSQDKSECSC